MKTFGERKLNERGRGQKVGRLLRNRGKQAERGGYLKVDPGEALLAGEVKVSPHQQVEQGARLAPRRRQLGVTAPQDLNTRDKIQ